MLMDLEESVVSVYEMVKDSVVSITTVRLLDLFFLVESVKGIGAGFVMDSNGILITNAHVVEGAREIQVTFQDGEVENAKIVDLDRWSDIAFLKVERRDLRPLVLGDSDKLKVGQFVIAVGSPFSHIVGGISVTFGVVSGLNRSIKVGNRFFEDLIQTDAAINPGNSGGPLLNLRGEVVGVNTAMIPYAQGIGFAIPVNEVKFLYHQLLRYGRIVRPWIGIYGYTLDKIMASQMNIPYVEGVVVIDVAPGSPAQRAGLVRGDVITYFDSYRVKTLRDLRRAIRTKMPGEQAMLTVMRRGYTFTVPVVVEVARM